MACRAVHRGQGRRAGTLGSLVLATYQGGDLVYVGNVGTGFNDREIDTVNWTDCEPKTFSYALEADEMIIGLNEIKLEPAYALSQTELGIGSDPRQLGVGFSRLLVLPEGQ